MRTRRQAPRREPPRRGHTRWLLVLPVVGIAVILAGVWALEAIHPQLDADHRVEGLPPLALDDAPTCTRQGDGSTAESIRERLPIGGRISSTQVVNCPVAYDGAHVLYAGEVVGEVLPRRGGAWAQVNDDAYALEVGPVIGHREHAGFNTGMSVWLDGDLAEAIEVVGRPGVRGDVVLLAGQVHRADRHDGGGITLRATRLEVLADGVEIEAPLHVPQLITAVVLVLVAVATGVWARRVRAR